MSLTPQAVKQRTVPVQRAYPKPPVFPKDMSHGSMENYRIAHASWWQGVEANLALNENRLAALEALANKNVATSTATK